MSLEQLVPSMEDVAVFLEEYGDRHWPTILRGLQNAASRIEASNQAALRQAVSKIGRLFGGMGSLNDLYLCPENGHNVPDERRANADFSAKLAALFNAYSDCITL